MIKKSMIAGAVALGCAGVQAASANLTVTGTISPEACSISLGGSAAATVDYGKLQTNDVKKKAVLGTDIPLYDLGQKSINLQVNCASPTVVVLHWVDNKSESIINSNASIPSRFGLGVSAGKNIGIYSLDGLVSQIATTASGSLTNGGGYAYSASIPPSWNYYDVDGAVGKFKNNGYYGFKISAPDTSITAIYSAAITLYVNAYVSKSLVDTSASEIKLDGSSTVSLEYL